VLCEGDMVEYQADNNDRKGKYRAIKVTGGRKEGGSGGADKQIAIQLNKQILSSDSVTRKPSTASSRHEQQTSTTSTWQQPCAKHLKHRILCLKKSWTSLRSLL
jgi:hypothetical protein